VRINQKAPKFEAQAYLNKDFKEVKLDDYKGKWVVLFFYPADFTFVCPTELGELADSYELLQKMGVESRFVYFPEENHFVLKPQNARVWWESMFSWFEKYYKR